MEIAHHDFLTRLLTAPGPSGFEGRASHVWLEEAESFAKTSKDHHGNAYATINPDAALRVMLVGHIDEIGVMVTHVDSDGFISFANLGGWDARVLIGQRMRLLAKDGDLIGVVGIKPTHLMTAEERGKNATLEDLWLDTGLEPDDVKSKVRVGDVAVIEQPPLRLGQRIVSKALDNRVGAFIVLEALRRLQKMGCAHAVTALAASQEEIGAYGARVATFDLKPHAAIIVDVNHETKQPGMNIKRQGELPFGSGANLSISALTNPSINRALQDIAVQFDIKLTLSADPTTTGTDADQVSIARAGVPSAVLGVPLRYMHSPVEMVDERDIESVITLMVMYVAQLPETATFPR
jgi:putative aminopeptidase FrvX